MLINITPNSKVIFCMHASGEITDDPVKWSNTSHHITTKQSERWEMGKQRPKGEMNSGLQ